MCYSRVIICYIALQIWNNRPRNITSVSDISFNDSKNRFTQPYSYRKAFTGFCRAAFNVKVTSESNAMRNKQTTANTTIPTEIFT